MRDEFIENMVLPTLSPQEVATGLLDIPPYHKQQHSRACIIANFCSIFQAVTGQFLKEAMILEAAKSQALTTKTVNASKAIPSEILLKLFQTDAFKNKFPNIQVQIVPFLGTDFEDIANFANRTKEQVRGAKVYCLAGISSEVSLDGWHNVILLSANENSVIFHDPSDIVGSANRKIPKNEFIKRWGETFLAGNILIALPKIQVNSNK